MESQEKKCPEFVQQLLANLDLDKPNQEKEIKTDSSSDEDETLDIKVQTISPSKYFGKRVSFDYHNLKKIEKPIPRRASLLEKIKENKELSSLAKKGEKNLVKFEEKVEEIKVEEQTKITENKQNSIPSANQEKKKPQKKSILKNTCFSEEIDINKIFLDQEFYKEILVKVNKDFGGNQELIKENLTKVYNEFTMRKFKEGRKDVVVNLLKVYFS